MSVMAPPMPMVGPLADPKPTAPAPPSAPVLKRKADAVENTPPVGSSAAVAAATGMFRRTERGVEYVWGGG